MIVTRMRSVWAPPAFSASMLSTWSVPSPVLGCVPLMVRLVALGLAGAASATVVPPSPVGGATAPSAVVPGVVPVGAGPPGTDCPEIVSVVQAMNDAATTEAQMAKRMHQRKQIAPIRQLLVRRERAHNGCPTLSTRASARALGSSG